MPLFDQRVPRLLGDMPLTTICSGPVAAGMTKPPGHMQNKRVLGSRKILAAAVATVVLYLVDQLGGMLQSHAHSNALGCYLYMLVMEVAVYVARTVTGS